MESEKLIQEIASQIHPIEIESFDGRFNVQCVDENMLKLTMTMLNADHKYYLDKDEDWIQTLEFEYAELDRLIDILREAKKINTVAWSTIKNRLNKATEKDKRKSLEGLIGE